MLIVTILSLDLYRTLDEKIGVLKAYFIDRSIVFGFFYTSFVTLLVLITSYVLLNVSRWIINMFDNRLTPWVYKHSDPSSIVVISQYRALEQENKSLRKQIVEEKEKAEAADIRANKLAIQYDEFARNLSTYQREWAIESKFGKDFTADEKNEFIIMFRAIVNASPVKIELAAKYENLGLIKFIRKTGLEYGEYTHTPSGREFYDHLISYGIRRYPS